MTDRRWLLFFAPVILVAVEVIVLSALVRRSQWEVFELAPLGIGVAVLVALACSSAIGVLTTRDADPIPWGKRTLIVAACLTGQVALSCAVGAVLFRG